MDLSLTTILAVYGSILATITLIGMTIRDFYDRAIVRVTLSKGIIGNDSRYGSRLVYFFKATNVGRRVVVLNNAGVSIKGKKTDLAFIDDINLPIKLSEGENFIYRRGVSKFHKKLKENRPDYVWFGDSKGKRHKSKKIIRKNGYYRISKSLIKKLNEKFTFLYPSFP
jgi:hypothetical protein